MTASRLTWKACAAAALLVTGAVTAQAGTAAAAANGTLYVSPGATAGAADRSCGTAGFRTIQSAVHAAAPGATVVACPGTYHEQVVLSKPLRLRGERATIDEAGVTPAFTATVPGSGSQLIYAAVAIVSSRVSVTGLTVRDAAGEGVLAAGLGPGITGVTVAGDTIVHNDLGSSPPGSPYFECQPLGAVPGDCGEALHLTGVAGSRVTGNRISGNSGGALITDDTGPTHGNLIAGNVVTGNVLDCGITVPGHNPAALSAAGTPQPSVAGVYGNVIRGNVVTGNGTTGAGAGVLFANEQAGTASYDNLVEGNYIAGNGQSGVTMHAHALKPGQSEDLSGNTIEGNTIGRNNVRGDQLDGPPGPSDPRTTAVLAYSGGAPFRVRVAGNRIARDAIGVWLSQPVAASGLTTNAFTDVTIPVSANN